MKIDEEAVEIVREHGDFREAENTEKLFIISPISEEGEVYYIDLRDDNWKQYGYKGTDQVALPEMKPPCIKEVKSQIRARDTETLDQFA